MMTKRIAISGVSVHPHITVERVLDAVDREMTSLDNPGFCIACGEEADECEPDARKHPCDYCGKKTVYGAMTLLEMF
jgi:hypothetical protein